MTKVFPTSRLVKSVCIGLLGMVSAHGQRISASGTAFREYPAFWVEVNGGFANAYNNRLVLVDSNLFAASQLGLFVTSTKSEAWRQVRSGVPANPLFHAFAVGDGFVLAGNFFGGMFRSTNGGMDWVKADSTQGYEALGIHGNTVMAGGNSGSMRSTDGGLTWKRALVNGEMLSTYSMTSAGGRFLAAGFGAVHSSSDDGVTWESTKTGLPASEILRACAASGTSVRYVGGASGLYVARGSDTTWSRVGGLFEKAQVMTVMIHGNTVLVGTDSGIVISNNLGADWRRFDEGLPRVWVETFAMVGGTLYAGLNSHGVWRIPWEAVLAIGRGKQVPEISWVQWIPSDRNPILEITLPKAGRAGLFLSSISGRQIMRKELGILPAGRRTLALDTDLPRGAYRVEVRAGEASETKLMLFK